MAAAVGAAVAEAAGFATGELAHRRIRLHRINAGHLLPQLARRPGHRVLHPIEAGDVAPTAGAALRAEQLLKPLIAEHQHRVGLDHQAGAAIAHAAGLELLGLEQVEEMLTAIAADQLIGMGGAEELAFLGPAPGPLRGLDLGVVHHG